MQASDIDGDDSISVFRLTHDEWEGKSLLWPFPPTRKTPYDVRKKAAELQDLVSRLTSQLLHGCGHSKCTSLLCDTGRRHRDEKPVRRYTPRSARAIAVAVASGSNAHAHICRFYVSSSEPRTSSRLESGTDGSIDAAPKDPSSLVQQLAETKAFVTLASSASTENDTLSDYVDKLLIPGFDPLYESLEPLFVSPFSDPSQHGVNILSKHDAVSLVGRCMHALCAIVSSPRHSKWARKIMMLGQAYPYEDMLTSRYQSPWLHLLDDFEHQPALRLVYRLVQAVAYRSQLERAVAKARGKAPDRGDNRPLRDSAIVYLVKIRDETQLDLHDELQPVNNLILFPWIMVEWLKKAFLKHWDGDFKLMRTSVPGGTLELLRSFFRHRESLELRDDAFYLPVLAGHSDALALAKSWLQYCEPTDEDESSEQEPFGIGKKPQPLKIDDELGPMHILSFSFIFPPRALTVYFRAMNHLIMSQAHGSTRRLSQLRHKYAALTESDESYLEERLNVAQESYLLLKVSRSDVLRDAFDQLWQRQSRELFRPLRIRLGDEPGVEVGQDLGGVQIEFFNLVCREAFNPHSDMFTIDEKSGLAWFRPCSLQPLHMFELLGLLFGLAVHNGITIPVSFPLAFYSRLLGRRILGSIVDTMLGDTDSTLDGIRDGWPDLAASLEYVLETDVEDMEMVFPLEANGLRLTVPIRGSYHRGDDIDEQTGVKRHILRVVDAQLVRHHPENAVASSEGPAAKTGPPKPSEIGISWPGWRVVEAEEVPEPVSAGNKLFYVRTYIDWLTKLSIQPQWEAFIHGLFRVLDPKAISIFSPESLKALVEGTDHLNIDEWRRRTQYEGYDPNGGYMKWFWTIVYRWSQAKQRGLLKFVTAAERIPITGFSNVQFRIQKTLAEEHDPEALPSSSTCFGNLYLPQYATKQQLEWKLSQAIELGMEGFGSG